MIFAPQQYLAWANQYYGQVRFDLATSGLPDPAPDWLTQQPVLDDYQISQQFTEKLASLYDLNPAEIVLTLGTSQALFVAMAAVLSPGERVLVEYPTYEPLWAIPATLGCTVQFFARHQDGGLDWEAMTTELKLGAKLVVLTNPHNPFGLTLPDQLIVELAGLCERYGAWLLVDEVYRDFAEWRLTTSRQLHPNILAISSLTKVYGLSWLRCGWLLAPEAVSTRGKSVVRYVSGNNPPVAHALGRIAFEQRSLLWQHSQTRAKTNFPLVTAWLKTQPNLTWTAPASGLFGFVRHRSGHDLRPLIEAGLQQQGVLVAPGSFFGDASGFRLSWGIKPEQLPDALERLDKVVATI